MENISPILANLETIELQILGSLFKIKSNNVNDGVHDLEGTARRLKAMVKSLKCRCNPAKEELKNLRKENEQMKDENEPLKHKLAEYKIKEEQSNDIRKDLEEKLIDSQCMMASLQAIENAADDNNDSGIRAEQSTDDSQELFNVH